MRENSVPALTVRVLANGYSISLLGPNAESRFAAPRDEYVFESISHLSEWLKIHLCKPTDSAS